VVRQCRYERPRVMYTATYVQRDSRGRAGVSGNDWAGLSGWGSAHGQVPHAATHFVPAPAGIQARAAQLRQRLPAVLERADRQAHQRRILGGERHRPQLPSARSCAGRHAGSQAAAGGWCARFPPCPSERCVRGLHRAELHLQCLHSCPALIPCLRVGLPKPAIASATNGKNLPVGRPVLALRARTQRAVHPTRRQHLM